jgi:hypothetical protein
MSVEFQTDRAPLAGSTGINTSPGGSPPTEDALDDPGDAERQDDAPPKRRRGPNKPKLGVLVLTCAHCHRAIAGTGAGYAYVSLVDTQRVAQRAAAGYHDPAKARWTLAHRGCAPEALAPLSPHFRLWTDRIGTTDALLDAMVTLSREGWFAWSDWGALARDILADTETATIPTPRHGPLLADDPRHGTVSGYTNHGCRCDRCSQAQSDRGRLRRRSGEYVPGADAEHGIRREYLRGCRCDDCRAANAAHGRAMRQGIEP